jgi:hypothetical protein
MAESRSQREDRQIRAERLGRGLRLEPTDGGFGLTYDIALAPDGSGPELVEGLDSLVQDLRMTLMTGLGTDPFDQSFGFDGVPAMASEGDPLLLRQRLRVGVVRVLQADPRVARVNSVEIEEDSESRVERRLQMIASFQVEDGSEARLHVDVGAVA